MLFFFNYVLIDNMNIPNFVTNGIIKLEQTLNNPTFTWKNNNYVCVPNTLTVGVTNSGISFQSNSDFEMTVRLSQFNGVYPQPNDYIYYSGYKLLVKQIKQLPHNVFWVFVCSNPSMK